MEMSWNGGGDNGGRITMSSGISPAMRSIEVELAMVPSLVLFTVIAQDCYSLIPPSS